MINLQTMAFLNIELGDGQLSFGPGLEPVIPACRALDEARYAFLDATAGGRADLYYMYRNVARDEDRAILAKHGLRFDITVIMPGLIGQEYNKTVGHYHPVKSGTSCTYPEVYEVLSGEATYLLQRPGDQVGRVADAYIVTALAGDKVVIPPGYGHITINAKNTPLVMANWVAAEFASVYGEIKELCGGAYYLLEKNLAGEWMPNPRYTELPALRFVEPQEHVEFGLKAGEPMYRIIIETPDKLRFLTHPEEFVWVG